MSESKLRALDCDHTTQGIQHSCNLLQITVPYFSVYRAQLFSSTLTPASYVLRAPSMWMNCDTLAPNLLVLRTMLISTCQSLSSSKLLSRAEITADDGSVNSSDSDWLPMSVRMHPCPINPSWHFSAVIRSQISLVSLDLQWVCLLPEQ